MGEGGLAKMCVGAWKFGTPYWWKPDIKKDFESKLLKGD